MDTASSLDPSLMKDLKTTLTRFMMTYKFALDEVSTKIEILKQEFQYTHDYNPIEHIKMRLKSPESIIKKVHRKGLPLSLPSIKENIHDIAGIRITCSFISDIYKLSDMLQNQQDIKLIRCKDYIKSPKPNGYQSLHLIIEIPIFMSDRVGQTQVEVQIRTIAMDFWASLEHKIYYKYGKEIPQALLDELKVAASTVSKLDRKMEDIHDAITVLKRHQADEDDWQSLLIDNERFQLPNDFFRLYLNTKSKKA